MGELTTEVVPIYEGDQLIKGKIKVNYGGLNLTKMLFDILNNRKELKPRFLNT